VNAPPNTSDHIEENIAERRDDLHAALKTIVARVDELRGLGTSS